MSHPPFDDPFFLLFVSGLLGDDEEERDRPRPADVRPVGRRAADANREARGREERPGARGGQA